MGFLQYGIKYRSYLIGNVRSLGYKAFQEPNCDFRGFFGELFDEALFALNSDHVLGTESQFLAGLCTVYYDGSGFKGFTALTRKQNPQTSNQAVDVVFDDYDRITIIIETLDQSITFPEKFLILTNHNVLDLDSNSVSIPGRIDGSINITNGTLNLSGISEVFSVNNSSVTINHTGSGSYLTNGIFTT